MGDSDDSSEFRGTLARGGAVAEPAGRTLSKYLAERMRAKGVTSRMIAEHLEIDVEVVDMHLASDGTTMNLEILALVAHALDLSVEMDMEPGRDEAST